MRRRRTIVLLVMACAVALTGGLAGAGASPPPAKPPAHGFSLPALLGLKPRQPPPALVFTYDGFQIDASAARRLQAPDKTIRALKAQIDLTQRVGLKPDMLQAMRATRILADPAKTGDAFRWTPGQGLWIRVRRLNPKKPILLAGLLSVYQRQHLVGGPAGADLARFRLEALALRAPAWPHDALMLKSDDDYFALTGATYLYGAITLEPYNRANLRLTQPRYYHWLADLFDGGKART